METPGETARRRAWSAYWQEGALHSCSGSYARNYDGVVGDFWDAAFGKVRPSSRILDLGTGNGALPLRLWERFGAEAGMRIDAVDLASISPGWFDVKTHPGIRFHGGVPMEALPFPDAAFDLALGQYSLEYARWPESLHECLRVLAADGGMAFVLHHAESVLVRVAREEVRHIDLLCAGDGLVAAAQAVLPWLARVRAGSDVGREEAAMQARARYNAAMGEVSRAIDAAQVPDQLLQTREWVHRLLGAVGADAADRSAALAQHGQDLRAASLRAGELVEHALTASRIQELASAVSARHPDWPLEVTVLEQAQGILGWGFRAGSVLDRSG
jgi:hypothetical protein